MAKAIWRGRILAESDRFELVEDNVYFPPASLNRQYLKSSNTTTICPWKGMAHYYTVIVDGQQNPDAAWYYPAPKPAAAAIRDHVAFWHGVAVER
jgi:uncharacterized protein (DUF427 family)